MATRIYPGFDVGPVRVDVPLVLAPMEDVTNLAYRLIAKRIGKPGLMFTEFVSAMAVHHNAAKTVRKMRVDEGERPLGIQIFGADPEIMAETARFAESMGADIVDINMGCWVPRVCRTGAGAALLNDPITAEKIVQAVVDAVKVPVTVKVRAGWDRSSFAAPDLAKRFEQAGAQMMTLHARFAKQGFEGEADWKLLAELRKAITIPLVGNGDVKTAADAKRMMDETGCSGVMVGRASISNPWALASIRTGLTGEDLPQSPTSQDRFDVALEHSRLMVRHQAEAEGLDPENMGGEQAGVELRAIRALRGQLPLYVKGLHGSPQIRAKLSRVSSLAEIEEVLTEWITSESETSRP